MKIEIDVRQTIEIPKDLLLELANDVRERWNTEKDAPVSLQDIVLSASLRGYIDDLPERAKNNQLDREHIEMLVEQLKGKTADLAQELVPNVLFE